MTTNTTRIGVITSESDAAATRSLLACAVATAPVFAVVSLAQAFTRQGFDLTRHPLSVLSNGSLGWIQITNFLVSGALTVAGAVGLRRALRGTPGGTWASRLFGINGIGMMAAGVFRMDPADGFPTGTPAGQPTGMSWHSYLHMAVSSVAFVALIAACFVLGRHFSRAGQRSFAITSRVAGLVFAAGLGWAMTGGRAGSLTLCVGVLIAMFWVSLAAVWLRARAAAAPRISTS